MQNFHIYDPIGKGKASTVYKGRRKRTVEYVAVKSVPRDQKQTVMTEVKVMHALNHPNVLRFHAWYETQNHLWLILEYCVGGDLAALLKSDKALPEAAVLRLGRDLAAGLQALHAASIVHNDLRPANILLDEHGRAKLGGFSRAGRLEEVGTVSRQQRLHQAREQACLHYLSPELLQGAPTSIASDLWALGCLLYECAAGVPPYAFVGNTVSALTQQILSGQPPPLPGVSPELSHLLSRLLHKSPAERCSWADLCAHPFWGAAPPTLEVTPEQEATLQSSLHQWLQLHGVPAAPRSISPPKSAYAHHRISSTGSSDLTSGSGGICGYGDLASALAAPAADDPSAPTPAHPRLQQLAAPPAAVAAAVRNGASAVAPQFLDFSSVASDAPADQLPPPSSGKGTSTGSKARAGGKQAAAPAAPPPRAQSPPAAPPATALLWHPSDSTMKPIVGNRRIEPRQPEPQYDASLLPFAPMSAAELMGREMVLSEVAAVLGGAAHGHTKQAVMSYLETLCSDNAAVHLLLNSRIGENLVALLRPAGTAHGRSIEVQCQAAHLLGLLIRHASVISESLAAAGILDGLTAGVSSASVLMQRRSMATLGELLFYIASQQRTASPQGGGAASGTWEVGGPHLAAVLTLLEGGRDEVAQHYAAKAVENICGLGGAWAQRLATPDMLSLLLLIVRSQVPEGLRATAASALQRLLRCAPHLLPTLLDHPAGGVDCLIDGMADNNLRVRQAAATMLCQALVSEQHSKALVAQGEAEGQRLLEQMAAALAALMDSQVDVLRAKALVAGSLLVRAGWRGLAAVASSRLLQQLDRIGLATSAPEAAGPPGAAISDAQYLAHAAAALRCEAVAALLPMLAMLSAGQAAQGLGSAVAGSDAALQLGALQAVLSSAVLREGAVTDGLVTALADMLTWAVGSRASREGLAGEAIMLVLAPIDAVCSHADMLVEHHSAVLGALLPALSAAGKFRLWAWGLASSRQSADTRFCCLKLLCDVVLSYVAEPRLYYRGPRDAASDEELGLATAMVDEAVARHTLPLLPSLFQDEDPMPLYALKMLGILLEVNLAWAADLGRLGLARRLFEWLEVAHPHNNVHNIRLCRLVVQAGVLPPSELAELRAMARVVDVLRYASDNGVEPFLEPALDLAAALLALGEQSPGAADGFRPSWSRQLLPMLPLVLQLCSHADAELAAGAASLVASVVRLLPREAATTLASSRCMAALTAALKADGHAAAGTVQAGAATAREEASLALLLALHAAVEQDPAAFRGSVLALRSALLTASRSTHNQRVKQAAAAVLTALQH